MIDVSAQRFITELRKELGSRYIVRVADGGSVYVELRSPTIMITPPAPFFAEGGKHYADLIRRNMRKLIEQAGLPEEHGYVKISEKLWMDIRWTLLGDKRSGLDWATRFENEVKS